MREARIDSTGSIPPAQIARFAINTVCFRDPTLQSSPDWSLLAGSTMRTTSIALVMLSLAVAALAADNWPQFRGPHGDSRADDAKPPLTWSEKRKHRLEDGHPRQGLVVAGRLGRSGLAHDRDGRRQATVRRLRRSRQRQGACTTSRSSTWRSRSAICPTFNSYASPTPAIEAGRVYVHFGSYGTACLDTDDRQDAVAAPRPALRSLPRRRPRRRSFGATC